MTCLAAVHSLHGMVLRNGAGAPALDFVLVSLKTDGLCLGFAEEMSFETGRPPFSQIMQHLDKTSFLFYHQPPHEFGF